MRARLTDSIASVDGWSYAAGTEVLVAGDRYTDSAVPESVGQVWLSTGLLEPVRTPAPEVATTRPPQTTAQPAADRRPHRR